MIPATDVLATFHNVLLIGFLCVTLLLLVVTIINRLRVQQPILSWRHERTRVPVWPTAFIGVVLLMLTLALVIGQPIRPAMFAGYLLGGTFWFAAVWLSGAVVITEHGIVRNINCAADTVAWGQMVDYFVRSEEEENGACYTFFFIDVAQCRRRLEIEVPCAEQKRFQQVVSAKLDARFEFCMRQAYGKKALEG